MRKRITTIIAMAILVNMLTMAFGGTQVAADTGSMQGWWRFDEVSGSVADDFLDPPNDGILSGGKFGNALEFDGASDYVKIEDDDSLSSSGDVTLEVWIKADSFPGDNQMVVGKWNEGIREYEIQISNGKARFYAWDGSAYSWAESASTLSTGIWYHIAGIFDDTNDELRIYINGNPDGTPTTFSGSIPNTNAYITIGAQRWYDYYWRFFDGIIDEVRISNVAYSSFDLTQPPSVITGETAALWHFDESTGGYVYDDASGNTGTIFGATWAGPTWTTGKYGNALQFDGIDDYVQVPTNPALEPSVLTVEAWVKSSSPGSTRYILGKGGHGCWAASYALYTSGGGLQFYIFDPLSTSPGYVRSPNAGTGIWDDQWHHIAGTFDGSYVRLYVDGSEVGSGTPTTISIAYGLPTSNDLFIGKYGGTRTLPFAGCIDEVRIWDKPLTHCQIQLAMSGKLGILPDAGVIIYKSAFHNIKDEDIITVGILPEDSSISIVCLQEHHTTPKKGSSFPTYIIEGQTDHAIAIKIPDIPENTKTAHYWIMLSNGEHVGLNLHFGH